LRELAGPVPTVVAFAETTIAGDRVADPSSGRSLWGPLGREQQRAFNSQRARLTGQAALGPVLGRFSVKSGANPWCYPIPPTADRLVNS
jgi:hypothetical protein